MGSFGAHWPMMDAVSVYKSKWVRRAALIVVALLAVWLVVWLAVPPIAKSQLEKIASDKLGRQVTVGTLDFKPWSLELTIGDLRIAAADPRQPLAAEVGKLYADANFQSVLRLAPVIDAVRVERPHIRIVRGADGHFDFEDVLQRLAESNDPNSPPVKFAVYNISVVDGAADVEDRTVKSKHELRNLELNIPFLSNLQSKLDVLVEPKLAFTLNGSRFDSSAHTMPFAESRKTDARVHVTGLDLAPYLDYIPAGQPFKLLAGVLDLDLGINFQQGDGGGLSLSGTAQVRQAKLADASGRDVLAFEALKIALADTRPLEGRIHLGEVALAAPNLTVSRAADGRLNLVPATVAKPARKPDSPAAKTVGEASKEQAWHVQVDKIGVHRGQIRWRDAAVRPAAALDVSQLELQAGNVRWPMDKPATFSGQASVAGAALRFDGQGTDQAVTAAVKLDGLPLSAAGPYLAQTLEPKLDGKLSAQVDVAWTPSSLKATAKGVQADNLALTQGKTALAGIGRFEIADAVLDLEGRKLEAGSVRAVNPKLQVERDKDGQWMYERWLKTAAKKEPAGAPGDKKVDEGVDRPWALSIGSAAIEGGAVAYADGAGPKPVAVELAALSIKARNITVPGSSAALPIEVSGQLRAGRTELPGQLRAGRRAEPGHFSYNGKLALKPLSTEGQLDVKAIPVHAFKAYYSAEAPNIDVRRAYLNYRGDVRYAQESTGTNIRLTGDTALEDLRIDSPLIGPASTARQQGGNRLLSWKTLSLRHVRFRMAPGRPVFLGVQETSLVDLFARLLIDETGNLHLQDYVQQRPHDAVEPVAAESAPQPSLDTQQHEGAATAIATSESRDGGTAATGAGPAPNPPAAGPAPQASAALAPRINLGPLSVVNGQVDFTDRFIKPNYSADLRELTGKFGAVSSNPKSGHPLMADLELRGKVQQTAELEITGKLNPLIKPLELDISARMRNLELAPLSPYSARYTGYGIERGKLSADLSYKVGPDGGLTATNKLVLNQLQFGSEEVPGAQRTLPVRLAVALLADSHGVIDIDLPVSGSINDPQFSIGPLIWKGIFNLIAKAVTSPLRLLTGRLGSGSVDSNSVIFAPGSSALDAQARENLDKVAKALNERAALKVTVVGTASLEQERSAYQREGLRQLVFAEKRRQAAREGKKANEVEPVTDGEYPELLRVAYERADITKPRNMVGLLKDLPVKDMENLLMASIPVNDENIRQLGTARGAAVRDYLLECGLSSERLFLGAVQTEAQGSDWKPGAELKIGLK